MFFEAAFNYFRVPMIYLLSASLTLENIFYPCLLWLSRLCNVPQMIVDTCMWLFRAILVLGMVTVTLRAYRKICGEEFYQLKDYSIPVKDRLHFKGSLVSEGKWFQIQFALGRILSSYI